jgi:UDP-glucuronate 4-epimerase
MTDRAVVTGAAGFIGSHLVEALLANGVGVLGIDSFTDYYSPVQKRENLAKALGNPRFEVVEEDLADAPDLPELLDAPLVIHLAAEAGVRRSWGDGFERYVTRNVLATQRLLEACLEASPERVVVASSSSVYGDAETFPTPEESRLLPRSPYGITKLATENLARTYAANWGLPTVSLRFFTVFGPRQRPDMAFHRLIEAAIRRTPFPLYGTGDQIRDFTYVSDVVRAICAAGEGDVEPGSVYNVAGGVEVSLGEVIGVVEELTGFRIDLDRQPVQAGDARRTGGSTLLAESELGWTPEVSLREGIASQISWHREGPLAEGPLSEPGLGDGTP